MYCVEMLLLIGVPRILQWRSSRGRGNLGDGSPPVWSRGSPGGRSGGRNPPKLTQNVKLVFTFLTFSCRRFRI